MQGHMKAKKSVKSVEPKGKLRFTLQKRVFNMYILMSNNQNVILNSIFFCQPIEKSQHWRNVLPADKLPLLGLNSLCFRWKKDKICLIFSIFLEDCFIL